MLHGDTGEPRDIETRHLTAIRRSDFLYVVNPEGYVGPSAILEMGYAVANSIPIFCSDPPTEPMLSAFSEVQPNLEKVKDFITEREWPGVPKRSDLATLQDYVGQVVRLRGFEHESVRDVALLLVEEVGELAKAIRLEVGLMTGTSEEGDLRPVAQELADCLVYLLDLANLVDIDLEQALRDKERINRDRVWSRRPSIHHSN